MGLSLEAFRAGYKPETKPTNIEKSKPTAIPCTGSGIDNLSTACNTIKVKLDKAIPKSAPIAAKVTASKMK